MAHESIRPSLANAQDEQEDRAAAAPTLGLGMIDVPAAMATTVKTANQTAVDILEAIPEGSSVTFSADQLAFLLSTDERIGPVSEAHARVEHFARACGCSVLFRHQAGTGTFTKEKRTPKTALAPGLPIVWTRLEPTSYQRCLRGGYASCHPTRSRRQRIPACNRVPLGDLMSSSENFIQNGAS